MLSQCLYLYVGKALIKKRDFSEGNGLICRILSDGLQVDAERVEHLPNLRIYTMGCQFQRFPWFFRSLAATAPTEHGAPGERKGTERKGTVRRIEHTRSSPRSPRNRVVPSRPVATPACSACGAATAGRKRNPPDGHPRRAARRLGSTLRLRQNLPPNDPSRNRYRDRDRFPATVALNRRPLELGGVTHREARVSWSRALHAAFVDVIVKT